MAKQWIGIAKDFIEREDHKEGDATNETQGCEWGFSKKRSKWSENRAIFVAKPDQVLEAEPGQVIFAPVEIKNETKWPWKKGCFIGLLDRNAQCELIVSDVPVDFEVRGM